MKQRGFTVIEIVVAILLLLIGSWLFFNEKAKVDATARDQQRKVAINAMYYNLEEVYFENHNYYPTAINSENLRAMDPELFKDPFGNKLGDSASNYRYEGTGCSTEGQCKGYTLKALMEREADYSKSARSAEN